MGTRLSKWLISGLALVGLLVPFPATALEATWERFGLEGRQVRAIAIGPQADQIVALTGGSRDPSPLWIRNDRNWSQPVDNTPGFILALASVPDEGLLLATGRDISDQPGMFMLAGSPPAARRFYDKQAIGALAVASGKEEIEIYAATAPWADRDADSDLLRMGVESGSWSSVLRGSLVCGEAPSYFKQVIVAPDEPSTLLALEWCFAPVLKQTQLWRSDDAGLTWQVLPRQGAAHSLIGTVAIDPTDPSVLYLAGPRHGSHPAAGIESSTDGGQTWVLKGDNAVGLTDVRALLVDPREPRRILAGTAQHGVFSSEDWGESWHLMPGLEHVRVWDLAINAATGRVYAATSDGVWTLNLD